MHPVSQCFTLKIFSKQSYRISLMKACSGFGTGSFLENVRLTGMSFHSERSEESYNKRKWINENKYYRMGYGWHSPEHAY